MNNTALVFLSLFSIIQPGFSARTMSLTKHTSNIPESNMSANNYSSEFQNSKTSPSNSLLSNELIEYFYNLYEYSPKNSQGSCGYVSLIQYLSYYDSFYNDSIIPEEYERNKGDSSSLQLARTISPGVERQNYPGSPEELYTFINNHKDTDYQMKLMSIVNESMGHSSENYSWSIGMWNYYRIFNTIPAFENTTFNFKQVKDFGADAKPTDSNVMLYFDNFVKSELDKGNPVILHIAKYNDQTKTNDNYHSVVAYYYDNQGIHANFGWGNDSTDTIIPSTYQITEAGLLDFSSVQETHSNNFWVSQSKYCGCGYHFEHGYSYKYEKYSAKKHKAYCYCGDYLLKSHAIRSGTSYTKNGHTYATCVECGTLVDLNTTIVIVY